MAFTLNRFRCWNSPANAISDKHKLPRHNYIIKNKINPVPTIGTGLIFSLNEIFTFLIFNSQYPLKIWSLLFYFQRSAFLKNVFFTFCKIQQSNFSADINCTFVARVIFLIWFSSFYFQMTPGNYENTKLTVFTVSQAHAVRYKARNICLSFQEAAHEFPSQWSLPFQAPLSHLNYGR